MALPLKNHLKAGSRDGSQDTSQGRTRLWPTSASRLSGGTVILVGSEGVRGGRGRSDEGAGPSQNTSWSRRNLVISSRCGGGGGGGGGRELWENCNLGGR